MQTDVLVWHNARSHHFRIAVLHHHHKRERCGGRAGTPIITPCPPKRHNAQPARTLSTRTENRRTKRRGSNNSTVDSILFWSSTPVFFSQPVSDLRGWVGGSFFLLHRQKFASPYTSYNFIFTLFYLFTFEKSNFHFIFVNKYFVVSSRGAVAFVDSIRGTLSLPPLPPTSLVAYSHSSRPSPTGSRSHRPIPPLFLT
jgi:hypothetical protein